jgi:hypothetical protein
MTVPIPGNAVVYRTNTDDPRSSMTFAVAPNGRCLLLAGSNRANRQLPVGYFQGMAPPALMTSLRQWLFSDAFRQSVSLASAYPDEPCRSILVPDNAGAPVIKLAGDRGASSEFLMIEEIFTSLIAHAARFPAVVLLADTVRPSVRASSGEASDVTLRLRNPGPFPVLVPAPENWDSTDGFVELSAMRAGPAGAAGSGTLGEQWFSRCDARTVTGFQARSVRGLVPILPNGSVEIRIGNSLHWPKGRYMAELATAMSVYDGNRTHQLSVIASTPYFNIDIT